MDERGELPGLMQHWGIEILCETRHCFVRGTEGAFMYFDECDKQFLRGWTQAHTALEIKTVVWLIRIFLFFNYAKSLYLRGEPRWKALLTSVVVVFILWGYIRPLRPGFGRMVIACASFWSFLWVDFSWPWQRIWSGRRWVGFPWGFDTIAGSFKRSPEPYSVNWDSASLALRTPQHWNCRFCTKWNGGKSGNPPWRSDMMTKLGICFVCCCPNHKFGNQSRFYRALFQRNWVMVKNGCTHFFLGWNLLYNFFFLWLYTNMYLFLIPAIYANSIPEMRIKQTCIYVGERLPDYIAFRHHLHRALQPHESIVRWWLARVFFCVAPPTKLSAATTTAIIK